MDAYIKVVKIIPLAPMEAMIPDYDAEIHNELEPKPEPNIRVLIDPETLTTKELDPNFMVAYNIAEYNVID